MKRQLLSKVAVVGLTLIALATGHADLLTPGMGGGDSIGSVKSMETKGGVSAQFWLTSDEQIFSAWTKSGSIRNLKPITEVKRNTPVFLALFLANPGVRRRVLATGKVKSTSDVSFDLFLITPAGSLCLADKQRTAWKGTAPAPQLVYLAKDRGFLGFEAIDPLGEYTVIVIVHDNVQKVDIKLTRKLVLVD